MNIHPAFFPWNREAETIKHFIHLAANLSIISSAVPLISTTPAIFEWIPCPHHRLRPPATPSVWPEGGANRSERMKGGRYDKWKFGSRSHTFYSHSARRDVHSKAFAQSIRSRRVRDIVAVRERESFRNTLLLSRVCARKRVGLH